MSRPLRLEFPGAIYHLTSRGNARAPIFADDGDRELFLGTLAHVVERFHWRCHAYCLMDNHYHLLIETLDPNLSKGMRQLNGLYTQRFNRRHGRVGHVFQGRFKAILVERDSYLLELCRYVVLNPVRAKMVKQPKQYQSSSYRATAGIDAAPPFLTCDWVLSLFGKQRHAAQLKYRAFVKEGIGAPSPWEHLRGQVILGTEAFANKLKPALTRKNALREVPRVQRLAHRPALAKLLDEKPTSTKARRQAAVRAAHVEHGYTLAEIGAHLGIHYTTVSRIVNR